MPNSPATPTRNDPHKLRQQLDGSHILRQWLEITNWLVLGYKPVYAKPIGPIADLTKADYYIVDWQPLDNQDVSRLTKALDNLHRMVNKLLPELKAIDVADSRAERTPLSSTEKATRLYAAIQQVPELKTLLAGAQGQPPAIPGTVLERMPNYSGKDRVQ